MKIWNPDKKTQWFIILMASMITIAFLSPEVIDYKFIDTRNWQDLVSWSLMVIGVYACYYVMFKFYNWFNGK